MYNSLKVLTPNNNPDKTTPHSIKGQLYQYKLDIDEDNLVTQWFGAVRYKNKSSDITKNILCSSSMRNIEEIILLAESTSIYKTNKDKIYQYNCVWLSHDDKTFSQLLSRLGIDSINRDDPSTNTIAPGCVSQWHVFGIPIF